VRVRIAAKSILAFAVVADERFLIQSPVLLTIDDAQCSDVSIKPASCLPSADSASEQEC